jgi:hypothetical protein
MARLTNIRERIDDVLTFETPDERRLTPLGHQEGECDDSFVVMKVASPPGSLTNDDEVLRIAVNDKVCFAWPLRELHDRYARHVCGWVPDEIKKLHQTIAVITSRVEEAWRDAHSSKAIEETNMLSELLKSYTAAVAQFLTGPGLQLSRAIIVPPRSRVRVETTGSKKVTVYLRGLRSRDVT